MRVSGASDMVNSRQNDQHAKKGKTEGSARGRTSARNTGGGVLAEVSERKHLTSREVERLIEATKGSRNEVRDRCLLLLMFRHGLRVSEACGMKLDQVDTESRVLACGPVEGRIIDDAALTQRRAEGYQRMAQRTRPDEADRQGVFCQ